MHIAGKLFFLSMVAILGGCSSLNPFSTEQRNTPAKLLEFKQTLNVRNVWSYTIGKAGNFVFSPAMADNSIFVAASDGSIARLDGHSGQPMWRNNAGVSLTAGVGADGHTVAVAAEKGVVMAFDGNGKLRWTAQTSSEILSAPAVGQGVVVVRSLDNKIVAFDAESGTRRWTVQRTAPSLTLRAAPGIAIVDLNAYVAMPGGRLLALALSNGGVRWEVAVGDPRGTTELERVADVSGTPIVFGHDVCAVAYQGRVACFELSSGSSRWAKKLSSNVGLAIDERFTFAVDDSGAVNAFMRESGQSVWRNDKLANRRLSTPVSYGRAVATGDLEGYVHFLSREDGSFIGRMQTDGGGIIAPPLVVGANLIFQTQSGAVVALAIE